MKRFESKFELTENLFRYQAVGEVDVSNPDYQKALKKLREEEKEAGLKGGQISFEKTVELAKKFQPHDPTHPIKPFARDMRISLLDLMIGKKWVEQNEEDQDRVKFYTAVGTPLDKLYGAHAFIEYKDRDGERYYATLDLSLAKKAEYKSDIIISKLPDPHLEEEKIEYLATIEKYANQALRYIEMRRARRAREKTQHKP